MTDKTFSDESPKDVPPRREVRSFMLRKGRMSPQRRQAYRQLSDRYLLPYRAQPLDFAALFPAAERVVAEIGFGMGRATAAIAADNPSTAYLGIEVHTPGVARLMVAADALGLENIRIIEHDAVEVFTHMIPDGSLSGIHLFFPDPWPKKKHHKRRLVQDDSIGLFVRKLRPGGYFYAATDWEEYALHILEVLGRSQELRNTAEGFAERPAWRPLTAFERKGREQGRAIREIIFEKTG